jgi:GMP synthase (glutamine-hydrolysing)
VAREPAPELPGPDQLAALVVMGGLMNTDQTEEFPGLLAEMDLIRSAVALGVPTLGICLGHQLLAQALGGGVVHADGRELGFVRLELTPAGRADPALGLFDSVRVLQWHGDNAIAPPGAQVLAVNSFSDCQAFRFGAALGVQFHIEVGPDQLRAWWESSQIRADWARHRPGADLFAEAAAAFGLLAPRARAALSAWATQATQAAQATRATWATSAASADQGTGTPASQVARGVRPRHSAGPRDSQSSA